MAAWTCGTSCGAQGSVTQTPLSRKEGLEERKLDLEIRRADKELQLSWLTGPLPIVSGLLALAAFLWTVTQGLKTFRHQAEAEKASRIAGLLQSLSDEKQNVRVGAARGLTRYADDVVREVLSAYSLEEWAPARVSLGDVLMLVSDRNLDLIFDANRDTLRRRAEYIGRLEASCAAADYCEAVLELSPFAQKVLRDAHPHSLERGKQFQCALQWRTQARGKPPERALANLADLADQSARMGRGTAMVISRMLLRPRANMPVLKGPLWLSAVDLHEVRFRRADLSGSVFARSDLAKADLAGATLERCDFTHALLSKAELDGAHLSGACLAQAILAEAKLRGASLRNADLRGADLTKADLTGADLNGTKREGARLEGAVLTGTCLDGANRTGATHR